MTVPELDFSRCPLPPFQHQREDTEWLLSHPYAMIASEMRTGKSKIVLDAAQHLFVSGEIERVIIVGSAPLRDLWYDPILGQIHKHTWKDLSISVVEFHSKIRSWSRGVDKPLEFYITNFEYLRDQHNLKVLYTATGMKTLLIGDESSFLKNWTAQQTKAFYQLRRRCGWCWLLNGTPIFHSPLDLFSQGNILHPTILECPYITLFKARYAVQTPVLGYGGKPMKKVVGKGRFAKEIIIQEVTGWKNEEDLQRRFAPYTRRRLQKDCLDLPPKLDPVTLTATLTTSWKYYKQMKDHLVVWLTNGGVVTSATAATRVLRLSQITGGFLSGVEAAGIGEEDTLFDQPSSQEIGREKLDVLLWFIRQRLEMDPHLHLVVWVRFRAELFRMLEEIKRTFPQFDTGAVHGDQPRTDRLKALALLHPDTSPQGPVFVGGIEGTGSFGLNMTAAHTCVTMSSGYSPGRVAQTLDRVYGPGQEHPIAYYNIIAAGPQGQRTIDHDILVARLQGENIAQRTAAAWVQALTD